MFEVADDRRHRGHHAAGDAGLLVEEAHERGAAEHKKRHVGHGIHAGGSGAAVEEREFYRIGVTSGIDVGQEIVTPLPMNSETGELELPKEAAMPAPAPEPTVYDLFGTRKRQLPPIEKAPKADDAPVEGKEIRSSKFGFEGVREFKLDDIMRELLERAGVSMDSASGKAPVKAAPATQSDERSDEKSERLDKDGTEKPPENEFKS